jgi:tRNA dimethylallyltransferase
MQVYRGLDIGTAKATPEMQDAVRHHLLDLVDPEEDYSVAEFQREGRAVLSTLVGLRKLAVICGGSGLHYRSLVDPLQFPPSDPELRVALESIDVAEARSRLLGMDPAAAEHVDLENPRRVVRALEIAALTGRTPSQRASTPEAAAVRGYEPIVDFVAVGFDPGVGLAERVTRRFDGMLDAGLLDEVDRLRPRLGRLAGQAVGYKELVPVAAGDQSLADGRAAAIRATRALAKRQRTYFRRDPRINWITWDPDPSVRLGSAVKHLDGVVK